MNNRQRETLSSILSTWSPLDLWQSNKRAAENHVYVEKRHQVMISETSTLVRSYTTSKGNKSSSLRCGKT